MRTVFFVAHSSDPEESDALATKCVEYQNRALQRETEANATPSRPATSTPAFVYRVPNIPCLLVAEEDLKAGGKSDILTEARCVRFQPSNMNNGFFIACMKKEVRSGIRLSIVPQLELDSEGPAHSLHCVTTPVLGREVQVPTLGTRCEPPLIVCTSFS